MYDHIVVPLDGSLQSELALPIAVEEAWRHGAVLVLIHAIPVRGVSTAPRGCGHADSGGARSDEDLRTATRLGRRYLDAVARRWHLPPTTSVMVAPGASATEILALARRLTRPLIVVTVSDAFDAACPSINSMGQRLVDESTVPVLGVRNATPTADWHSMAMEDSHGCTADLSPL